MDGQTKPNKKENSNGNNNYLRLANLELSSNDLSSVELAQLSVSLLKTPEVQEYLSDFKTKSAKAGFIN